MSWTAAPVVCLYSLIPFLVSFLGSTHTKSISLLTTSCTHVRVAVPYLSSRSHGRIETDSLFKSLKRWVSSSSRISSMTLLSLDATIE